MSHVNLYLVNIHKPTNGTTRVDIHLLGNPSPALNTQENSNVVPTQTTTEYHGGLAFLLRNVSSERSSLTVPLTAEDS